MILIKHIFNDWWSKRKNKTKNKSLLFRILWRVCYLLIIIRIFWVKCIQPAWAFIAVLNSCYSICYSDLILIGLRRLYVIFPWFESSSSFSEHSVLLWIRLLHFVNWYMIQIIHKNELINEKAAKNIVTILKNDGPII